MTIRLTTPDERGETEAGRREYSERRRYMIDHGFAAKDIPPDLYNDDQLDDETDPTGAIRHWRRIEAEAAASKADEAAHPWPH